MRLLHSIRTWSRVLMIFLQELAKATAQTVRAVYGDPGEVRPAIASVPLDVKSPAAVTLFANMVSLTPGTTSLDVDPDGRRLFVHFLDAPDQETAVVEMKRTLESRVKELLP